MSKFIIYLLESSVILAVFYVFYIAVLKKETFFNLNRFFLIGIVVFSLLLPLMSFDFSQGNITVIDNSIEEFGNFRASYYETAETWEYKASKTSISTHDTTSEVHESTTIDWTYIFLKFVWSIYIIGVLFCLSKLFWNFRKLQKMILKYPQVEINGIKVVKVSYPIAPFSFLKHAFVYEGITDTLELDQIIVHEKTHIEQKHSFDLLFIQFIAAFLWFNPLIWILINSLKAIHEYIADKKIIKAGYSLVDYQTLLLRQLVSNNSHGLVNNFNLSFIKKRIIMMKHKKSGLTGKLKAALTITCAILFSLVLIQCNSKTNTQASLQEDVLFKEYLNNKDNPIHIIDKRTLFPTTTFVISDDKVSIDGKLSGISEIAPALKQELIDQYMFIHSNMDSTASKNNEVASIPKKALSGRHFPVRLKIDGNQKMKKVREFHTELRRLDRRKVIYYGETASGKQMIQPFLVPPFHWADPSRDDSVYPKVDLNKATITGNVATLNGIEYLQLNLSSSGINYKEEVYQFIKKHIDEESISYLVSLTFDDNDTFKNYLTNLAEVFQGFEKIYDVRAQELFGKKRKNLNRFEISKVSNGVYKAVFIAEN
ncbi:M56 family metallopeptidase [Kordia sp.]|uniref:M56 family metallopeptidase n=1 Tax=Kordia sp. TaxID=1965332 RepID=UPI0025BAB10D|nr:M56 family metallopeptidase [Kordia sp.]MCH2195400.1 M56 family metallopeptidase [Kordia sp.]